MDLGAETVEAPPAAGFLFLTPEGAAAPLGLEEAEEEVDFMMQEREKGKRESGDDNLQKDLYYLVSVHVGDISDFSGVFLLSVWVGFRE